MSGTTTVARKRTTGKTLLEPTSKKTAEKYQAPKLEIPVTPERDHIEGPVNAAETAEAASAQEKFWPMHDFLYEHQATLGDPTVALGYAKKLGLNTQRFEREIAQHLYQKRIKDDFMGGVRSGVNGTPTFYVNGIRPIAKDPFFWERYRALDFDLSFTE